MEVAILQPYDVLKRHSNHHNRRQFITPASKSRRNPSNVNPNPNPNPSPNPNPNRSNRRKRNSPPPPSSKTQQIRLQTPPVMGQVRILKRGEDLSLSPPLPSAPVEPEPTVIVSVRDGFYAGSACVTSPSPSELPLPGFFSKRNCGFVKEGEAQNQEIACELRRVLKLI